MKIIDIFEYLKEMVGCSYISDLQYGNCRVEAIRIVRSLDSRAIAPKQVNDVKKYLGIH